MAIDSLGGESIVRRVPRAPQRDVSNWRGQSGPMPAGAARCSKEIPRPWNAKGTRRNMGWVLVSKSLTQMRVGNHTFFDSLAIS